MKNMKLFFAAAFMLIISSAAVAQVTMSGQMKFSLANPGKQYTLEVQPAHGSIKITGYSGNDVVINSITTGAAGMQNDETQKSEVEGMRQYQSRGVQISGDGNKVIVKATNPTSTLNIDMMIPQNVLLKVSTLHGSVTIDNLSGEIEIISLGGNIDIKGISGSVVINTSNSEVNVDFAAIDAKMPTSFLSTGGKINVSLPETSKANIKILSTYGAIYSDFDIEFDASGKGKINGGGAEMSFITLSGNIFLRKSKK